VQVIAGDGVVLHAEAHGAGIPLLLSCAYCTTCENFRPQVEPLVAAGARVVLWDYRGHGRSQSPRDPDAYSMERVVDDLGRVLDAAAPGRAVLGGLSFGGLASLHYALRRPERVAGLVLVGSGPGFKNAEAQARWAEAVERTAGFVETRGLAAFLAGRASLTLVGAHPERHAAQAAARAIARQDPVGLALFGRRVTSLAPPVIDELARIRAPALVIVGEGDEAFRRAAEVMAARLPRARHVVLPGVGHMVNLEAEAAFNGLLLEFLEEILEEIREEAL
jgi:pimeloyl-ACP methyl ester carboxylesterase